MTKTIIAIGGGEIGRIKVHDDGRREQKPIETMVIDKKIIELTGKEHPTMVFIGAASGDNPAYFTAVKNHFADRLGCRVENLALTQNLDIKDITKNIMDADIIYVGGGNVTRLIKTLHETGADNVLIDAYNCGIIMSGNSAGGCVWFEYYGNDEDDDFDGRFDTFKSKKALGLVRGYFEPHWNTKPEEGIDKKSVSKNAVQRMLARESKFGYGVDEGAAIMVQTDEKGNQTMTEIISGSFDVKTDTAGREILVENKSKPLPKIYKLNHINHQYINSGKGHE